ncbi:MAG: hypothetical protein GXO27_03850 [Chlorobi bacterium]|nr:hypothetical protein [Chlorobiota bacterium]
MINPASAYRRAVTAIQIAYILAAGGYLLHRHKGVEVRIALYAAEILGWAALVWILYAVIKGLSPRKGRWERIEPFIWLLSAVGVVVLARMVRTEM